METEIRDMNADELFKLIQFAELYDLNIREEANLLQYTYTN